MARTRSNIDDLYSNFLNKVSEKGDFTLSGKHALACVFLAGESTQTVTIPESLNERQFPVGGACYIIVTSTNSNLLACGSAAVTINGVNGTASLAPSYGPNLLQRVDDNEYVLASAAFSGGAITADSAIIGDPGNESGGVTVDGVLYAAPAMISQIGGSVLANCSLHRHSTTNPIIMLATRSNSDTAAHAAVVDGMPLFWQFAAGYDGNDYSIASQISYEVDGTVADGQVPGRIVFLTTSATGTLTERVRIDKYGALGLAGANFGTAAQVIKSAGAGAPVVWDDVDAVDVLYNNAVSGLASTDVQGAIDELAGATGDFTITTGTFSPTWVGFSANPSGTVRWTKYTPTGSGVAYVVLTRETGSLAGTSNATNFQMGSLPADIRPATSALGLCMMNDSGTIKFGVYSLNSSGTMSFWIWNGTTFQSGGFTASGTKGLYSDEHILYTLHY